LSNAKSGIDVRLASDFVSLNLGYACWLIETVHNAFFDRNFREDVP